ncbi:MAG: hypothetical protein QOF48_2282, partial [Verrucomicrobiota bacterium]
MTPPPIIERELRLASRRPMTYWSRSGVGLLALVLTLWTISMRFQGAPGVNAGREAFVTLAIVAICSAVATALRLTTPTIAIEKRDGTLGLLFLTDLKPHDIILGKLAVATLTTLHRFLAVLPVLGIPILMGGVTGGDLARLAIVLLNLMFLAATLGMFASTLATDEKGASGLAGSLMILIAAGGPLAGLLALWLDAPPSTSRFLVSLSPGFACVSMISPAAGLGGFWTSWIAAHLCAWSLLAGTCWILPRVWQDRPATAGRALRNDRRRAWLQGDTVFRRQQRVRLMSINPILWLNSRDRAVRWYPWIFLAAVGVLAVWIELRFDVRWTERGVIMCVTWVLNIIFKNWIGSQAAMAFSADRDRGALELLLSTPMRTGELVRGYWLNLRRLFAAPGMVMIGVSWVWTFLSLITETPGGNPSATMLVCTVTANFVVFCADVWALGWLG